MDLIDSNGDVIGYYDPTDGSYAAAAGVDPAIAADVAAQWWAVGYGAPATDIGMHVTTNAGWVSSGDLPFNATEAAGNTTSPGEVLVSTATPPADPIAAGIDPLKIVKTTDGSLWKYAAQLLANGTRSYTPVPYRPAGTILGLSPMMLMLIGVVGFVALGDSGKSPKRRGR